MVRKDNQHELDDLDLCDTNEIKLHQSVKVEPLQWVVFLGMSTAVMILLCFRSMPSLGHLLCAKCVVAYLRKMCDAYIHIWPHEPPDYYSAIVLAEYDSMASTYGEMATFILSDTPGHKGRSATLAPYVDAGLFHDWNTGCSVTGTLHSINVTPSDWYPKCQSVVETNYGSENLTAFTCA